MESVPVAWCIDLLGALRVRRGDQALPRFPTQKTASLLARLALPPYRFHTRDSLVNALWPDASPDSGRDRLSQALVWLRAHLEPAGTARGSILLADRRSVGLAPEAISTDVADFEGALSLAQRTMESGARRRALEQAAGLYGGELLPDLYDAWVLPRREELQSAYLLALHQLAALCEEAGDREGALRYARRAVEVDPLQEEAQGQLIRLLADSGRSAAALRQFEVLKRQLADALDVAPSPESYALREQIQRHAAAVPATPGVAIPRPMLPVPLTRFFGRQSEIERVGEMLRSARLVTITGIGGSGKTRLALETARGLAETQGCRVAFVPLADATDALQVPGAIADALRLPRTAAPPLEQIKEALAAAPSLLVLDNLEHLVPGAAPLVHELLADIAGLSLLATSRRRLGVEGEREMSLAPLALPDATASPERLMKSPSIQLFVDRARAVRPDFTLTPANAATVAQVCERLEGIPLALELGAAWAQTLTPSQMLEKLARRFDLLVSRRADITPRHRTLRAALEYSYLQLPDDLQRLFRWLSVFRGGWSLEAAEAVCGDATAATGSAAAPPRSLLADLTELRERSLILAEEVATGDASAEMRYRLLETLREFAGEQMPYADLAARRHAHAAYFLHLAEQAERGMAGPEQERWLKRLDREQENMRAALTWCLEAPDVETGLRLGGLLGRYWSTRGALSEGYHWLRRLLDGAGPAAGTPAPTEAKAWNTLGHLAWSLSDYATAYAAHERALSLRRASGDSGGIAESLYHLGITAYRQDDYETARAFLDESLALAREREDSAGIARVLLNLGNIAYEQQRHAEARDFFQQSLVREKALGNRQRTANALNNLGLIAMAEKDYPLAAALSAEALTIQRELTDDYGAAISLANLGAIIRLQGEKERARSLLSEGLALAHEVGNRHITAHQLLQLGLLASTEGQMERAVFLLSAAQHLFEAMGSWKATVHAEESDQALQSARAALGEPVFTARWSEGGSAPLPQTIRRALSADNNYF